MSPSLSQHERRDTLLVSGAQPRTMVIRTTTAMLMVAGQVVLLLACMALLRQYKMLDERKEIYRKRSGPMTGRLVPPIEGTDWAGAARKVEYGKDRRPTLVYSFFEKCPACQKNWNAMRSLQALSPSRLRIIYVDPYEDLTEAYRREHGLVADILFRKLDTFSEVSYQIRGTPQAELVDEEGRVVWSNVGAFAPGDLADAMAAIADLERPLAETKGGAKQ